MPLFICDCCGVVENTALGKYRSFKMSERNPSLCSKCLTGAWHGEFDYELCTKEVFNNIGSEHFVYWMEGHEPDPRLDLRTISAKIQYAPQPRHLKSKTQLKKLKRGNKKRK